MALSSGADALASSSAVSGMKKRASSVALFARGHRSVLVQLLSLVVFFSLWQLIGSFSNPILFATPTQVIAAFFDLIGNGQLVGAFGVACEDLILGYAIAVVLGLAIGILMGRSRIIEQTLNPYVNLMQATPAIALIPLMSIWFGIGLEARVAVVILLTVWTVIINTATGVKATPRNLIEVAHVYHLSERRLLREIVLPGAVPYIWAGLRIGLGKALIGMVVAEMEVEVVGLGGLITNYGAEFRTSYLLAAIMAASVVGVITAGLLGWSLSHFFPWVAATSASRD